jgi:hypothetical protein
MNGTGHNQFLGGDLMMEGIWQKDSYTSRNTDRLQKKD